MQVFRHSGDRAGPSRQETCGGRSSSAVMDPLSALAAASASGDDAATTAFLRHIWGLAFRVATGRFGLLREDAEEIAQDVCLIAIERQSSVLRLTPWVAAVAAHRAISLIRRRTSRESVLGRLARLDVEPIDSAHASTVATVLDLRRELATLPTATRTVLFMRFALDLSWAEIDHSLFEGHERSRHQAQLALVKLARKLAPRAR